MQLSQSSAQLIWIWKTITHVDVLQNEEVRFRAWSTSLTPRMRLGREQAIGIV
jgi:hypothetical protein